MRTGVARLGWMSIGWRSWRIKPATVARPSVLTSGTTVTTVSSLAATIYAVDLNRMTEFYGQLLGLAVVDLHVTDFSHLESADHAIGISIVAIPHEIAETITFDDPIAPREDTPIKLSFLVEDLDHCRSRATALGGALRPTHDAWTWNGFIHCDGHDPEGNIFQLRSPAPGTHQRTL